MTKRVLGVLAALVLWVGIVSLSSTKVAAQEVDGQDVQQEGQFGPGSTADTPDGVEAAEPGDSGLESAETDTTKQRTEAGKDVQEGPQVESQVGSQIDGAADHDSDLTELDADPNH